MLGLPSRYTASAQSIPENSLTWGKMDAVIRGVGKTRINIIKVEVKITLFCLRNRVRLELIERPNKEFKHKLTQ